jgi:hypothetical protein
MMMRGNKHYDCPVGTVMQTRTITPLTLVLFCTACPIPEPSSESIAEDSGTGGESDDTASPPIDIPSGETDETTETGDGDGDPGDGDGDTSDLRWAVLDGNDNFVGWLATPSPTMIADHDDIFSGPVGPGFPRDVYLTTVHEYAFWLVAAGPSYTTLGTLEATVLFTEPGCSGLAHDRIASMPGDGGPVAAGDCNDAALDDFINGDEVQMHYWTEQTFADWTGLYWPDALGMVMSTPSLSHFYWLPREQEWPEMLTAVSMRLPDGTCVELPEPTDACALRLFDTIWEPLGHVGPYSLREIED